jgi:hypothetical protein
MPTVTNTGPLALAASLVVALAVPASPAEKPADKRAPQAAAKAPADAVAKNVQTTARLVKSRHCTLVEFLRSVFRRLFRPIDVKQYSGCAEN